MDGSSADSYWYSPVKYYSQCRDATNISLNGLDKLIFSAFLAY